MNCKKSRQIKRKTKIRCDRLILNERKNGKRRNRRSKNQRAQCQATRKLNITADTLRCVKSKISQLEHFDKTEDTSSRNNFNDLIPFLLLYIFLNYDCINENPDGKLSIMLKNAQINADIRKSILKVAKSCRNKLDQNYTLNFILGFDSNK